MSHKFRILKTKFKNLIIHIFLINLYTNVLFFSNVFSIMLHYHKSTKTFNLNTVLKIIRIFLIINQVKGKANILNRKYLTCN